jgi:maleamate amidohydrolase
MMPEDLAANYARAGFHSRIGFGRRPALILIDFVMAYYTPGSPLFAGEGVQTALDSALRVLEVARRAGVPRIFTNVVVLPGGFDGGIFYRKAPATKAFEAGSPLGAWPPGLLPQPGELVISKQYPSAFFGTSLASTLTANGIDSLILTGITTSGCVRATCVDTMSFGFIPIVVREGVGDRAEGPHEANLFDMNAKYADVLPEAEVIAYLRGLNA